MTDGYLLLSSDLHYYKPELRARFKLVFVLSVLYSNIILTAPVSVLRTSEVPEPRVVIRGGAAGVWASSEGFSGEVIDGREENVSAA